MSTDLLSTDKYTYIATFFSHFGAIRFQREWEKQGICGELMPVPRDLSSSCGTCLKYCADRPCPTPCWPEEVEQVVLLLENGKYRTEYTVMED